MTVPNELLWPSPEFAASFAERVAEGRERLRHSSVAFVGLARSCAGPLARNLPALASLGALCQRWWLHVEENDSSDGTVQVLADFCRQHPQATFSSQTLGRGNYSSEFAGRRTIALAEYRDACQRWVRDCARDADYVAVVDLDAIGGWSHDGVLNGFGWLVELQGAYGMASVSLLQHPMPVANSEGIAVAPLWMHYDCWALRGLGQRDVYYDDYTKGQGGWKHHWLPPVGTQPALVASAFGGLCIYRTAAYLAGTYDGTTDCEHVTFHKSVAKATGQMLYLNPSQRCVMRFMEPPDAGHGIDSVRDVPNDAA